MNRIEPALEVVEETSGDGQVPVPLRPSPAVRVVVLRLSLLPRRTAPAAVAPVGAATPAASVLLAVVMVVMVFVLVLWPRRPVFPALATVVLMRHHAVHVRRRRYPFTTALTIPLPAGYTQQKRRWLGRIRLN